MLRKPIQIHYPLDSTYAVIRIDPVATLKSLPQCDEDALAAARAIKTKSYLVYINTGLTLPIPGRPWHSYSISPIAPCLRPAVHRLGFKSGMCVPIFPNVQHPNNRKPVHTEPEFPFNNCYHWYKTEMSVRVRARPDGWNETHAFRLPQKGKTALWNHASDDDKVVNEFLELCRPQFGFPQPLTALAHGNDNSDNASQGEGGGGEGENGQEDQSTSGSTPSADGTGPSSETASSDSENFAASSVESLGNPSLPLNDLRENARDAALLPLVDLSYDLTGLLKQDKIPNPLDLYRERAALIRIIKAARERNPNANRAPQPSPPPESRRIRAAKTLRQLRKRVVKSISRIVLGRPVFVLPNRE